MSRVRGVTGRLVPIADPCEYRSVVEVGLVRVNPIEREWRTIRRREAQDQKFIEVRSGQRQQASFAFVGFLIRMLVPSDAGSRPFLVALIGNVLSGPIDADNSDGDRSSVLRFELRHLASKVVYDSVDLPDHGLLNDFDFDTNLNCRNRPSFNMIAGVRDWRDIWNDFAEAAIAATGLNTLSAVLNVENGNTFVNSGAVSGRRVGKIIHVLEKLNRYEIALA